MTYHFGSYAHGITWAWSAFGEDAEFLVVAVLVRVVIVPHIAVWCLSDKHIVQKECHEDKTDQGDQLLEPAVLLSCIPALAEVWTVLIVAASSVGGLEHGMASQVVVLLLCPAVVFVIHELKVLRLPAQSTLISSLLYCVKCLARGRA